MSSTLITAATSTRSGLVDVLLLVAYALAVIAIVTIVSERRGARRAVVRGAARDVHRVATVVAPTRSRGAGTSPRRGRPPRAPDEETTPSRKREPRAPSETKPSLTPEPQPADTVASPIPGAREAEEKSSPVPERPAAGPTQASPLARAQSVAPARPTPVPEPITRDTSPAMRGRRSKRPSVPVVETCEIVWWRGLVKSQFYAAFTTAKGESTAIQTSPLFRLVRGDQPEPADEALAAHRALVSLLQSAGWEPVGQGNAWYAVRFHRVDASPPVEPAVADPQPMVDTRSSSAAVMRPAPVAERTAVETKRALASSAPEVQSPASGARSEPDEAPEVEVDRCEIDWWRGFVKSQFYAGRPGGEGLLDVFEPSPLFRWRGDGPPEETDEVLAAHRTLVANLRASGWEPEPARAGGPWYAVGFRRERS